MFTDEQLKRLKENMKARDEKIFMRKELVERILVRLENSEAERDSLKMLYDGLQHTKNLEVEARDKAIYERDRYRQALMNIVVSTKLSWFTKERVERTAKQALEGKELSSPAWKRRKLL